MWPSRSYRGWPGPGWHASLVRDTDKTPVRACAVLQTLPRVGCQNENTQCCRASVILSWHWPVPCSLATQGALATCEEPGPNGQVSSAIITAWATRMPTIALSMRIALMWDQERGASNPKSLSILVTSLEFDHCATRRQVLTCCIYNELEGRCQW